MSKILYGPDFTKATRTICATAGAVTVFGEGEMGKTKCAESLKDCALEYVGKRVVSGENLPYVISAADFMNVWMSPDIIEQAEESGLVTRTELESRLDDFYAASRIDPVRTVIASIPAAMREESKNIISLFAMRMNVMNPLTGEPEIANATASENVGVVSTGGLDFLTNSNLALYAGEDMMIGHIGDFSGISTIRSDDDDTTEAFAKGHGIMSQGMGRMEPKLINVVSVVSPGVPNVECGLYSATTKQGEEVLLLKPSDVQVGTVIKPVICVVPGGGQRSTAISAMLSSITGLAGGSIICQLEDASVARNAEEDMLINDMASMMSRLRTAIRSLVHYKDFERNESTLAADQRKLESDDITKLSRGSLNVMEKMLKEMDKVTLHSLLSELKLYPFILRQNIRMRNEIIALAKWWGSDVLGVSDRALLARTEQKSADGYGAEVFNGSIESAFSELKIFTSEGTIHASSGASMLETISGAMLIMNVIHVSALDLTVVRNLEVKTVTLTGGLDSTTLNIAQYISDLAYNANAFAVLETRDDFTKSDPGADIEEAAAKIRKNLGANSRFAIQLYGSTDDPFRSAWIRCKFYDEQFNDFSDTFEQVTREDYPTDIISKTQELSNLF